MIASIFLGTADVLAAAAEHWELIAGFAGFAALIVGAITYIRATAGRTTSAAYAENVAALESLVKTRDAEIADDHAALDRKNSELEKTRAELAAIRSEYKIVSGIVIADLIAHESRRHYFLAEHETLKSDVRILTKQVETLERKLAENGGHVTNS